MCGSSQDVSTIIYIVWLKTVSVYVSLFHIFAKVTKTHYLWEILGRPNPPSMYLLVQATNLYFSVSLLQPLLTFYRSDLLL